jgi:hypothetical protein
VSNLFDFSRELESFRLVGRWGQIGHRIAANRAIRSSKPILKCAERRKVEVAKGETIPSSSPSLYGSAIRVVVGDLSRNLIERDGFNHRLVMPLGPSVEEGARVRGGHVHWTGADRFSTLTPTRPGKLGRNVIPNLVCYRDSAVVVDLERELYETTISRREAIVDLKFQVSPLEDPTDPKTKDYPHPGFSPLSRIRSQHKVLRLIRLTFPCPPVLKLSRKRRSRDARGGVSCRFVSKIRGRH